MLYTVAMVFASVLLIVLTIFSISQTIRLSDDSFETATFIFAPFIIIGWLFSGDKRKEALWLLTIWMMACVAMSSIWGFLPATLYICAVLTFIYPLILVAFLIGAMVLFGTFQQMRDSIVGR